MVTSPTAAGDLKSLFPDDKVLLLSENLATNFTLPGSVKTTIPG
jgi:hypothetical protein